MRKITKRTFNLTITFLLLATSLHAQQIEKDKNNWQNLDLQVDKVFGVSTEKTYKELLKDKDPVSVIVAIIDGGVDISHEDLRSAIWRNSNEIVGNGKDDDDNGYIDDINGWNFMGSSKGSFHFDNVELVRMLREALKINPKSHEAKALRSELVDKLKPLNATLQQIELQRNALKNIIENIGKKYPSVEDFKNYKYKTEAEANVQVLIVNGLKKNLNLISDFEKEYQRYKYQRDYMYNINYDPRKGNNEYHKLFYGNNDVKGPEPSHGTHIAGLIVADRINDIGIKGIAGNAKIMCLTAIPEGDGLDKDIASAIRYAVDNGAKIINISSGKDTSPNRIVMDEAVRYAMEKGILIIHAAGNKGEALQIESGFPSRNYLNGGKAENWIEVGASGPVNDENLIPWFSNYGSKAVDVFAPGVNLYSTFPQNEYAEESGTSMAAPIVSGIAALIWSYYPKLTATQVKTIIMNSVLKVKHKVRNASGKMMDFSSVCLSGGIVNVFNAMQLARETQDK